MIPVILACGAARNIATLRCADAARHLRSDLERYTPSCRQTPRTSRTSASARQSASRLFTSSVNAIRVALLRVSVFDRGDVDPLAREDFGDVAQQSLAVHRFEHDVDRETPRRAARPNRRRSGAPGSRARDARDVAAALRDGW